MSVDIKAIGITARLYINCHIQLPGFAFPGRTSAVECGDLLVGKRSIENFDLVDQSNII